MSNIKQQQKPAVVDNKSYPITLNDTKPLMIFGIVAIIGVIILNSYYEKQYDQEQEIKQIWEYDKFYKKEIYSCLQVIKNIYERGFIEELKANKGLGITILIVTLFAVYGIIFQIIIKSRIEKKIIDQTTSNQGRLFQGNGDNNLPVSYVQQISVEEFERQKGEYTKEEVKRLKRTYEYRVARRAKGDQQEFWNWQTYERKFGEEFDEDEKQEEDQMIEKQDIYVLRRRTVQKQ